MNLIAKIAMVLSLSYYALILGYLWIGQMIGAHNEIWDMYDFPLQPTSPPVWTLLVGLGVTAAALTALGTAYQAIWRILNGGKDQDFRDLARRLRRTAIGLIGFWFGYNLLAAVVQYLIVIDVADTSDFDFSWDPFDLDIVFLIIAIALLAISQTLERAWVAEDETRHFL